MRTRPASLPPLLNALHALQDRHGHLPPEKLADLERDRHMPPGALADFASFFDGFQSTPGARRRRVCLGPACVAAGAERLLENAGGAPCQGRCEQAPVVIAEDDSREVPAAAHADRDDWPGAPPHCPDIIERLQGADLKGMGGAGFPAWRKWRTVREQPDADKVVIINADEGEPGTFKDRWLLDHHPAQVLAGALIAAATLGASRLFVYLRNEYRAQERTLGDLIARLRAAGAIAEERPADGGATAPERPEVTLVRGGGAYICGQETALIASLEGRRGEPAHTGPYPAERGLWGRPTLVHNVETLFYVAGIARHGAAWYADGGGRRHFSVSGAVARPGIYERPIGTRAADLLAAAGGPADGDSITGFIPGGGATGLLPASALDAPLTSEGLAPWGTGPGTGAVVFLGRNACPVAVAERLMAFFADESCGQCDPCRLGTARLHRVLAALRSGRAPEAAALADTAAAMGAGSICGLGRSAPVVATSLLAHFGPEVAAHGAGRCPAGVCFGART